MIRLKKYLTIMLLISTLFGGDRSGKIDISRPFVAEWLDAMPMVNDSLIMGMDSVLIDPDSPFYKYPGRALLMSILVPGLGQVYVKQPIKAIAFLAADVVAFSLWKDYNQQGQDEVDSYRAFADLNWDFHRWFNNAPNFTGAGWDGVKIDQFGSHELSYIVADMDGDGQVEYSGTTGETINRLTTFMSTDTANFVQVRSTPEYYENIGKYNQFFSGWSDADPGNPDVEETISGKVAWSPHRKSYVEQRGEANRLKSVAGYAVSAALFNHVLSGVDALFATSRWNSKHAVAITGRLMPSRDTAFGVQGIQLSLVW